MTLSELLPKRLIRALDAFVKGGRDYEIARLIVPLFYYLLFFSAFTHLEGLNYTLSQGGAGFDPRWPLFWARDMDFAPAATAIFVGWTLTALLAAVFPLSRAARAAAFVGLFFYHAYLSSFGGPNHQFDYFLWIAFIFVFLPRADGNDPDARRRFSLVFWCAQAYLLLTYSMAGTLKLAYGVARAWTGEASIFSVDAPSLHIATQLLAMNESVPLARAALEHPFLTYLFFLAVLYLQFFALVAAFRPSLHRLWGAGLVLFHVGTFLTMRAVFAAPAVLVMALLLSSPFAPGKFDAKAVLLDLPLVPTLRKILARLR